MPDLASHARSRISCPIWRLPLQALVTLCLQGSFNLVEYKEETIGCQPGRLFLRGRLRHSLETGLCLCPNPSIPKPRCNGLTRSTCISPQDGLEGLEGIGWHPPPSLSEPTHPIKDTYVSFPINSMIRPLCRHPPMQCIGRRSQSTHR